MDAACTGHAAAAKRRSAHIKPKDPREELHAHEDEHSLAQAEAEGERRGWSETVAEDIDDTRKPPTSVQREVLVIARLVRVVLLLSFVL